MISVSDNILPFAPVRKAAFFLIVLLAIALALLSEINLKIALVVWAAALIGLSLIWIKPKPLEVLLFLIPSLKLTFSAITGLEANYVVVVIFWVGLLFYIWCLQSRSGAWNQPAIRTPAIYVMLIYVTIFILSLMTHLLNIRSLNHAVSSVLLIAVYWIIAQAFSGLNFQRILKALIWGSAASSVLFLIFFSLGSPKKEIAEIFLGIGRPMLFGYNANAWAWSTMVALPLLIPLLIYGVFKRLELWLALASFAVILAEFLLCNSRSVMLGVFACTAFVMLTHRKARKVFILGVAATIGGLMALAGSSLFVIITHNIFRLQGGLSGRSYLWRIAANYITTHPFLGIGPGWFYERMMFDAPPMWNVSRMVTGISNAHNAYLMIGAELGLFALLPVFFLIGFFFYRSVRLWNRLKGGADFPILMALISLMIAGLVRSMFEADFFMLHGYISDNLPLLIIFALQDWLYAKEFARA